MLTYDEAHNEHEIERQSFEDWEGLADTLGHRLIPNPEVPCFLCGSHHFGWCDYDAIRPADNGCIGCGEQTNHILCQGCDQIMTEMMDHDYYPGTDIRIPKGF